MDIADVRAQLGHAPGSNTIWKYVQAARSGKRQAAVELSFPSSSEGFNSQTLPKNGCYGTIAPAQNECNVFPSLSLEKGTKTVHGVSMSQGRINRDGQMSFCHLGSSLALLFVHLKQSRPIDEHIFQVGILAVCSSAI